MSFFHRRARGLFMAARSCERASKQSQMSPGCGFSFSMLFYCLKTEILLYSPILGLYLLSFCFFKTCFFLFFFFLTWVDILPVAASLLGQSTRMREAGSALTF